MLFFYTPLLMQVTRHTWPKGHFKVWTTNQLFFHGPLPPTPGAETGVQSIWM